MTNNDQATPRRMTDASIDQASGLPIDVDANNADLGADAVRPVDLDNVERGSSGELEGGLDAGLTDLGDDVDRTASGGR